MWDDALNSVELESLEVFPTVGSPLSESDLAEPSLCSVVGVCFGIVSAGIVSAGLWRDVS